MKRLLYIGIFTFLAQMLPAQNSKQAEEILDKVITSLSNTNGIRIEFTGSENGILFISQEKFQLKNNQIQSWYDGETQWTYIIDNEEVNISIPSTEELQNINPYLILKGYKKKFDYTYNGKHIRNGTNGHEIVLKSKELGKKELIRIFISNNNQPLGIKIEQNGHTVTEINVIKYEINQRLTNDEFRFEKSNFPNAEIIDLR